jgi:hypothetical protein
LLALQPPPVAAQDFERLVDRVFSCAPAKLLDPLADRPRQIALSDSGLHLQVPRSWPAPVAESPRRAVASSSDGRVTVRLTLEEVGDLDVAESIARHEGRYLGDQSLRPHCAAELGEVWAVPGADSTYVGRYVSTLAGAGGRARYAVFASRGAHLATLVVEAAWGDRDDPPWREVATVLAGLRWGSDDASVDQLFRKRSPSLRDTGGTATGAPLPD